jgi:hypothetical protein
MPAAMVSAVTIARSGAAMILDLMITILGNYQPAF